MPYFSTVTINITNVFIFLYAYFNLLSFFMTCTAVFFLRHALFPQHCTAGIHWWAGIMTFFGLVNAILCLIMTGLLFYYR